MSQLVNHFSYNLHRVFWCVWRWQSDFDWGERSETGSSVGRAAARRKARARLDQARKLPSPARGRIDNPVSRPRNLHRASPPV